MKYLKGRNTPINYLGEGANVDSDLEDYPTGVDDGTLKDQKEEGNRAVLIAGSFSAYAHFPALLTSGEITSSLAGSPFSSIAAQTRSRLLPSNRNAPTLA